MWLGLASIHQTDLDEDTAESVPEMADRLDKDGPNATSEHVQGVLCDHLERRHAESIVL